MLKRAGKAGSHHVLRRQQGQKTEEADANPRQEPKRRSEETGAHPRRLSELGGFGKSGPGSLVRGSWWRLPSVFPSGSRSAVLGSRSSGVGGLAGGGGAGAIGWFPALPGLRAERCRSGNPRCSSAVGKGRAANWQSGDYLADPLCARKPGHSFCADYRLLCSGSIYRRTEGEWYKSEGARFLLEPPLVLYAVSRPFDEYPLELALRIRVARVEETKPGRPGLRPAEEGAPGLMMTMRSVHPDEEVARDLAALLTVLCRRLITVAGKSAERAPYQYPEFDFVPLPLATSMRKVYWPPFPATVAISFDGKQEVRYYNPLPKPVDPDPCCSNTLFTIAWPVVRSRGDVGRLATRPRRRSVGPLPGIRP